MTDSKSKVTVEKVKGNGNGDLRLIRINGPEGEEKLMVNLEELNQLKYILKATPCTCPKQQ